MENLAALIDHTLLAPTAGAEAVRRLCAEAAAHAFCAVCVNSRYVETAVEALAGTDVRVAAVAGFPLGANHSGIKAREAALAADLGAAEVDMVLPVGDLIAGDLRSVFEDVAAVRRAVPSALLKVILECGLLDDAAKRDGARTAVEAGADFVKTSTGFFGGGATEADVRLLRETVGPDVGVKASGGIKTREQALAMVLAGATRIGTSSGVAIVGGR